MNLEGKKRLVSFGCSFTSGAELIDHELLKISFDDCNKMKQKWLSYATQYQSEYKGIPYGK